MTYLALIVGAYVVTVITLLRPVHLRVWNNFGMLDVVVMVCLVLPFMIAPWFDRIRPRLVITRYAWFISAVMALDVLFFVLGILGPFGSGHPSLEALGSYFLGLAKPVLVPATLVLLVIAGLKGERMTVVALGFLCLIGETLYTTYSTSG